MQKPYVVRQRVGDFEVTSIVIDESEFMSLCDELRGIFCESTRHLPERMTDASIEELKESRIIPLIMRGTKTNFLFERYGVETDKACVIVRGYSRDLISKMASMN